MKKEEFEGGLEQLRGELERLEVEMFRVMVRVENKEKERKEEKGCEKVVKELEEVKK